jgi:4'-phosphopantetheinyl transferase EntD
VVIENLLPAAVATAEAFTDSPDALLYPAEAAAVARAVPSRRREFSTARACARAGLTLLGLPPAAITRGDRGAPEWPPGVVGSITHCPGYRAAAVARAADAVALGIDAEPDSPLPGDVLPLVSSAVERAGLADLAQTHPDVTWDRLLFSAKESVYKAWFPLQRTFLDFTAAEVRFDPAGRFWARLLVPGPVVDGRELAGFAGRFCSRDGLVLTAVYVPMPSTAEPAQP